MFKKYINQIKSSEFYSQIKKKDFKYINIVIFCIVLVFAIKYVTIGINNYLLDNHSFRQTQTALTAYYFVKDGLKLAYETPILGSPWTIPFEFPIYQWIVASTKLLTNANLDLIGRIVNLTFYGLILVYLFKIIQKYTLRYDHTFWILIFVLMHPIYIFWSRTFMIESTVLFFSIAYFYYYLQYLESNKKKYLILIITFGVLAALTKITTFLPFIIFVFGYTIFYWSKEKGYLFKLKTTSKYLFFSISIFLIPFLCAKFWVDFGDSLKKRSNYSYNYTSSKNLMTWNFGTIEQKTSIVEWKKILINSQIYSPKLYLFLILLIAFSFLKKLKFRYHILTCLGLYILVPFIFTNLHIVHDYYTYSNSIFLCTMFGFIVVSFLSEELFSYRIVGTVIGCFLILFLNKKYKEGYYHSQNSNPNYLIPITDYIKQHTNPNDPIIVYGNDWGSEYAYYSERKTIAITNIFKSTKGKDFIDIMNQNDTSKINTLLCINSFDLYYNKKFAMELVNYLGYKPILERKPYSIYKR